MTTALILAGAVAKGAYQAGVLEVLSRAPLTFERLVAASAGSLNASLFACGVRHGRIPHAVAALIEAWMEDAEWQDFLRPSLRSLLRGGVSSSGALGRIVMNGLEKVLPDPLPEQRADVVLQLVVAPINGKWSEQGARAEIEGNTTFEHIMEFGGAAFDSADGLTKVVNAVTASAAFPLLFAPVDVPEVGPCIDGGAVNNTPVSYGLESPGVHRVIVVSDNPRRLPPGAPLRGVEIVGRLIEMLVNERLFRDLLFSRKANDKLARLGTLADKWNLSQEQRGELMEALGWRPVELIEIRPERPLEGTPFSGLHDRGLRREYIDEGRRAAEAALSAMNL